MKKTILSLLLLAFNSLLSAECIIISDRSEEISAVFKRHGGWSFNNYAKVCEKLLKANAVINIVGRATVLSNRSISWVALSVVDRDSAIATADFNSMSTSVNANASQNIADEMLAKTINRAADDWTDLDKALVRLEEERKKAKLFFNKK